MHVCVVGTGCVGLITAACWAEIGHQVVCVDSNLEKVASMQSGKSPIPEPHLEEIIQANLAAGRLEFTTNLAMSVNRSEIIFIALETLFLPAGEGDTSYIDTVAKEIGNHLNGEYKVIVDRCGLSLGSGDRVRRVILNCIVERLSASLTIADPLKEIATIAGFDVVSNPDFHREGLAIYDTFYPTRLVLGSNSEKALAIMQELYKPLIDRQKGIESFGISQNKNKSLSPVSVTITDINSAETLKYAVTAFEAIKKID
jgi:UDPglucose 6-dehydrogenase